MESATILFSLATRDSSYSLLATPPFVSPATTLPCGILSFKLTKAYFTWHEF